MATQFYISVNDFHSYTDAEHIGTSSTSTDIIEVRIGDGTYLPDRGEVILGLQKIIRTILQGGLDQAGANLPLPTGAGG